MPEPKKPKAASKPPLPAGRKKSKPATATSESEIPSSVLLLGGISAVVGLCVMVFAGWYVVDWWSTSRKQTAADAAGSTLKSTDAAPAPEAKPRQVQIETIRAIPVAARRVFLSSVLLREGEPANATLVEVTLQRPGKDVAWPVLQQESCILTAGESRSRADFLREQREQDKPLVTTGWFGFAGNMPPDFLTLDDLLRVEVPLRLVLQIGSDSTQPRREPGVRSATVTVTHHQEQPTPFGKDYFTIEDFRSLTSPRSKSYHATCRRTSPYGELFFDGYVSSTGDDRSLILEHGELNFTGAQALTAKDQSRLEGRLRIARHPEGPARGSIVSGRLTLTTPWGAVQIDCPEAPPAATQPPMGAFCWEGEGLSCWFTRPQIAASEAPDGDRWDLKLLFLVQKPVPEMMLKLGEQSIQVPITPNAAAPGSDDAPKSMWKTDKVQALAINSDGSQLLSGHADGTIRLWDATKGSEIKQLSGHTGAVVSVAFSPDGQRAVSGSLDKSSRVWDLATGNEIAQFAGDAMVNGVAFAADGQQVLQAGADGSIRLWSVSDGAERRVFEGHLQTVASVSLSPDGTRLLTGSFDQSLGQWDFGTGKEVAPPLVGHTGEVVSVAYSPDGKQALSTSLDKTARIWDLTSGRAVLVLEGHTDAVTSGTFLPGGKQVATASFDRTVRVWDAGTGALLRVFRGHLGQVFAVAAAPTGTVFSAALNGTIHRWNPEDLPAAPSDGAAASAAVAELPEGAIRELPGHAGGVDGFAVLSDGKRIVTAGRDESVLVCDLTTGRVAARYKAPEFRARHEHHDLSFASQPNYRFCGLVAGSGDEGKYERVVTAAGQGPDACLRVFTFAKAAAESAGSFRPVEAVEFRPNVPLLADGLRQPQENVYHVLDLALSPDGRWLTVVHPSAVDVFDLEGDLSTGKPWRSFLEGEPGSAVRFHRPLFFANGELLIGGLRLKPPKWDVVRRIDILAAENGNELNHVLFNAQENWFFRADGETLVQMTYIAKTRKTERHELTGHTVAIRGLALSPDGKQVASSDAAGTVIVWNVASLSEARRCQVGRVDVPAVAFVSGGKQLLTGDSAGRLLLWDLPPPSRTARPKTERP